MARYIDVDKFAEAICKFPAIDENSANAVISLLRRQPTADVVEVKHGKWIEDMKVICTVAGIDMKVLVGYRCSVCGRAELLKEPYCNCGARMDGRSNE